MGHINEVYCVLLGTTNKMQRYTVFFIIVNALHVPGRETTQPNHTCGSSKQA
jgi:hypothetical protein